MRTTRLLPLLLGLLLAAGAAAQPVPYGLSSQRRPVTVTAAAVYQRVADGTREVHELSAPVTVFIPVGQRFSMSLVAAPATAAGTATRRAAARLSTAGDAVVSLGYAQPVGSGSLVLTLGLSLPSGRRELTEDEFATALLLGQTHYAFRVPSVGQGFNASPGVTLAFPLGDVVALGVGASYQRRGAFRPLAGLTADYDPGDELLLTGGADLRLGPRATLSADASYAVYQADRVGARSVYDAGDKVALTALFRLFVGYDELRLLGRFRSRGRSEVLAGGALATEAERTLPNHVEAALSYRLRPHPAFAVTLSAGARRYDATPAYPEHRILDAGLAPEVRLSRALTLLTHARYTHTFDGFTGYEAGAGLAWRH